MKVINWLFKPAALLRLRHQQNSPFKLKSETEAIKSSCIDETLNAIGPLWLALSMLAFKLGIKRIQNNLTRINRDEWLRQTVAQNPVFTFNQAARITMKYLFCKLSIPLFLVAEAFLYYLISSLFIPGGTVFMKLTISLFLAFVIMCAVNYGVEKYFAFREAVERRDKDEITAAQLRMFRDGKNFGMVLIALSLVIVVCAGLARIFFLENLPAQGLDPKRLESVQQASRMASILTLFVTVLTGCFMGLLKQDSRKVSEQFYVLKAWRRAAVRRNAYTQELIRNANEIPLVAEKNAERAWQLVIDLKRTFRIEKEFDEQYEHLQKEYLELKAKPGFAVTDSLYTKYSFVQSGHEELFKHGIMNSREIREKIAFASEILKRPEEYINEHTTIHRLLSNDGPIASEAAQNGRAKNHEFMNHKNKPL